MIAVALPLNEFILENRKTTLLFTSENKPEISRSTNHLFARVISNNCKTKRLDEYKFTYTEYFPDYLENKETRLVFLTNFRNVN